jgi:hypothetical protein
MVYNQTNPVKNHPSPDASITLAHLRALWPGSLHGYLLLWLRDSKRSLSFPAADLDDVAAAATKHSVYTDVYLGCGLSPTDNGPDHRCKAAEVVAIPGLWADVDIAGPAHKGKGLPPDLDVAWSVINDMPLPPSLVVNSGHGLQPWWLLPAPWVFAGGGERDDAASLVQEWQGRLHEIAARKKWTLDSTHDLARILRLPGTLNRKCEPVVPVTVDMPPAVRRYDARQLRDALAGSPARLRIVTGGDDRALALAALAGLSAARADDYDSWIRVGMVLHSVADDLLDDWDQWSRKSDKYKAGECAEKWQTFTRGGRLTLGSLIHWARLDGWTDPRGKGVGAEEPAGGDTTGGAAAPERLDDVAAGHLADALLDVIRSDPYRRRAWRQVLTQDGGGDL